MFLTSKKFILLWYLASASESWYNINLFNIQLKYVFIHLYSKSKRRVKWKGDNVKHNRSEVFSSFSNMWVFVSDLKENIQHKLPGASNAKGSMESLHEITDMEKNHSY